MCISLSLYIHIYVCIYMIYTISNEAQPRGPATSMFTSITIKFTTTITSMISNHYYYYYYRQWTASGWRARVEKGKPLKL